MPFTFRFDTSALSCSPQQKISIKLLNKEQFEVDAEPTDTVSAFKFPLLFYLIEYFDE